ncbi:hypothetical protein SODALDRAFT_324822 [Sodiomyces alkalinus F11]|uniref:Apple domain-containing protein n=1 Tax=Sodiomyces alkalinus (strain CBS 110278 / VKM F-3762 / F11) TaxID=1314773 RepID=A0A3N2PRP4_SODAK|nr:hypothetical protein SODALDRAFT_324822 [Sodiomyces alkalinus F11]ROT37173.1 hypothetical protein SODALDRAFT_324822 [Sodiomyces alkalinus F11]
MRRPSAVLSEQHHQQYRPHGDGGSVSPISTESGHAGGLAGAGGGPLPSEPSLTSTMLGRARDNKAAHNGNANTATATNTNANTNTNTATAATSTNSNSNSGSSKRQSLYHPPAAARGAAPPEIYWSEGATPSASNLEDPDDGASANHAGTTGPGVARSVSRSRVGSYTFYREPTPEPQEKTCGGGGGGGRTRPVSGFGLGIMRNKNMPFGRSRKTGDEYGEHHDKETGNPYGGRYGYGGTPSSGGQDGVVKDGGSGYGDPGSSRTESASSWTSITTASNTAPTSSPTAPASTSPATLTSASSDPPFPTTTSSGSLTCPESNYTLYSVPGSTILFLRLCGVDYSDAAAENIRDVPTESMAECMRNCAGTFGCTGCGWGPLDVGAGPPDFRTRRMMNKIRYARVKERFLDIYDNITTEEGPNSFVIFRLQIILIDKKNGLLGKKSNLPDRKTNLLVEENIWNLKMTNQFISSIMPSTQIPVFGSFCKAVGV